MRRQLSSEDKQDPRRREISGKCDLCQKKDGFRGHNLQQCRRCGVCVHESCYGLVPSEDGSKIPDWECMACQSLRWSKKQSIDGVVLRHKERPSECALCCVSTGIHAMHPLYDREGKWGKQVVLPAGQGRPRRLAWVHSLCAFYIGSSPHTQGFIYACDKHGSSGESDEEQEEDSDDEGSLLATHHFVFNDDPNCRLMRKEFRTLKCFVCGVCDQNNPSSFRFPVQCSKGDTDELDEYKHRHSNPDPCYVAMHVGCARWGSGQDAPTGRNGTNLKRLFYYPGKLEGVQHTEGDMYLTPVTLAYCDYHAKGIAKNKPDNSGKDRSYSTTSLKPVAKEKRDSPQKSQLQRNTSTSSPPPKQTTETKTTAIIDEWLPVVSKDILRAIDKAQTTSSKKEQVSQRRAFWEAESGLSKSQFKEFWRKVKAQVNHTLEAEIKKNEMEKNETKKKDESSNAKMAPSSDEGNPWQELWVPHYQGKKFEFGEWDTMQEVRLPDMLRQ